MRAEHIDAFLRATAEGLEELDPRAVDFGPLTIRSELSPRRQISLVAEVTGSVTGRVIWGLSLPTAQKLAAGQNATSMTFDETAAAALTEWVKGISARAAATLGEWGCACEVAAPALLHQGDDPGDPCPGPAAYLTLGAGMGEVELGAALSGEPAQQEAEREPVVSQPELDTLSAALEREGAAEVSRYDFLRPPGLDKPTREAIERRFAACARGWSSLLTQMLRAEAQVRWVETQLCPRSEISRHVSQGSLFAAFALGGEGECLLQLSPAMAFYAIDRLLGGPGGLIAEPRAFTAIEKGLMETLAGRLLEGYARSGEGESPKPRLLGVSNQKELADPADLQAPFLLASFQVEVGEITTSMSLALPRRGFGRTPEGDDVEARIARAVAAVPITCAARLAGVEVPLAQMASLRPGDLLALETTPEEGIDLVVDGEPRLRGTAVAARDRLAIRVTGTAERTDSHDR